VEAEDFSTEGLVPQKFPVLCKFLRTSVVCLPVTLTRPFASTTSRLAFLNEVLPPNIPFAGLNISNPVDKTEEAVNVVRSKS